MATTVFAESPVQMESNNAYPTFSNGLNVPTSIYDDQRALQNIAVELSKYGFATTMTSSSSPTDHLLHQNAMINGNSLDCHSSNSSDHGYSDADLFNLSQRKSQNTTECVPVPSSEHVAEIVGRQGCKIKALRAKTNTYIKTPVRGEEPVFVVTGRKEDVESAKQEILSAADHFTQIRASRRHSQGGIPAPGHITAYVRVPYKLVGLVVGPKGATIKRIQQLTHTYIITPSRDKEPIFEVTGLPDNVETARSEIEVHIASRTGSYSPSFDSNGGKQNDPSSGVFNEFHMNGTDTYGDVVVNEFSGSTDSLLTKNLSKLSLNHQHPLIGGQHHHLQQSSTQINNVSAQQHYGAASMNLLQSQVQSGCNAWLSYANSNGNGDQDEGVWSMSGDSPTSLSVDPLNGVPSCLSSIWSDLEDPKDLFPRRSASISVPGAENADSLNMSNHHQQQHSWTSGAAMDQHQRNHNGGHAIVGSVSQRRFSTAPTTTGLYRQVVQNMLSLNGASAAVGSGGGAVCTVCQKRPVQALFQPCNHRCFCGICATRLCQMPKPTCPLCQAPIASSMMIDPTPKQQQRSAS